MTVRRVTIPALLLGLSALECAAEEDIVARRVPENAIGGSDVGGRIDTAGGKTAAQGGGVGAAVSFGGVLIGGTETGGQGGGTVQGGADPGVLGPGGAEPGVQGGAPAPTCEDAAFVSTAQSSLPTRDTCAAWAARRSFGHALCACAELDLARGLVTTTFDSSDPESDVEGSAAVGVNDDLSRVEYLRIDGSLTVAGDLNLFANGSVDIAGDLRLAESVTAAGPISVGRDAWFAGNTSSLSRLEVERDLHVDPRSRLMSFGPPRVGGERLEESFTITPPCSCAASELLDVPGIVSDGVARNDNARIGLAPDALTALDADAPAVAITLSCGRFALQEVSGTASVTIRIEGATALFVDGDVELGPDFVLELGDGATLDWFVRGSVTLERGAKLGDAMRPGALRLYNTAPFELTLPGTDEISMNLYAPLADVRVGSAGNVYGAIFADSVTSTGTLLLDYDVSVLQSNSACDLFAPDSCSRCDDCAGATTCMQGTCGSCSTDADCCFPLVCTLGECAPLRTDD
jgi:hypothetical protein